MDANACHINAAVITSIALEIEHLTSEINQCEQILELCVHGESAVHGRRSAAEATCAIPEHFGNQTLKDVEVCLVWTLLL
jgi:hypothetical protein